MIKLPLSEKFVSFQGEAINVGKLSTFIRLNGCNLNCVFCDTIQKNQLIEENIFDVLTYIEKSKASNVVITGGEPLQEKYQQLILFFIKKIKEIENVKSIEIETNGTNIVPKEIYENVLLNLSPKIRLFNYTSSHLFQPNMNIIYKFPVDKEVIKETLDFIETFKLPKYLIYLMPLSRNYQQYIFNSEYVLEVAQENGLNFSPRLQYIHYLK